VTLSFEPGQDRVVISVMEQERVIDGVELPNIVKEDMRVGKVVSVGPKVEQWKVGDIVMFGPHAGIPISLQGVPFLAMKEIEVFGKFTMID
jgi:chaperonin GroES